MVEFPTTVGGFDVLVNGELFGRMQKGEGFFTDHTVVKKFLYVSPEDLVEIAKKADEAQRYGREIPVCEKCKGTPNFPRGVAKSFCEEKIHPYRIRISGRI